MTALLTPLDLSLILFWSSFCFWWDYELELCPWMLTLGHAVEIKRLYGAIREND